MKLDARILVAGAGTLIGGGLLRELQSAGYSRVQGADVPDEAWRSREGTEDVFERLEPQYVFVTAGHSGGIALNQRSPATLMLDNLLVASHLLDSAHRHRTTKLVYAASSCCYPRECAQPMRETSLFAGPLEPTSEAYATAKLAALKLCAAYRREHDARFVGAIPGDCFGPGDDFDPEGSHVVAALVRRMRTARREGAQQVTVWGTGTPRRDFVYVRDLARGLIHVMQHYDDELPINVGSGGSISVRELAEAVKRATGFAGSIVFDASRPDGMPLKALDSSRLAALGFSASTPLERALAETVEWYDHHLASDDALSTRERA